MLSGRTMNAALAIGVIWCLAPDTIRAQDRAAGPGFSADDAGPAPSRLLSQRPASSAAPDEGATPATRPAPEGRGSSRRTLQRPGAPPAEGPAAEGRGSSRRTLQRPSAARPGAAPAGPRAATATGATGAAAAPPAGARLAALLQYEYDPPLGFTGPSSVVPQDRQTVDDFVPMEDRWRIGFPYPFIPEARGKDVPYRTGNCWDPYNQNVLKGDYPIIGQHTFLNLTAESDTTVNFFSVPTPAGVSTRRPQEPNFFGRGDMRRFNDNLFLTFDIDHGDAGYKPLDWQFVFQPAFNINHNNARENQILSPDVRRGIERTRGFATIQEVFFETKLADVDPYYDTVRLRVGIQPFQSDFRGFIFSDINRAVKLSGELECNRDQWNIIGFSMLEKDTNSLLNTADNRDQNVIIANFYREDFIVPGYTGEVSLHYNNDDGGVHYDKNGFLVRPADIGTVRAHTLNVVYLGYAGDGHWGPVNVSHAFYEALGTDSFSQIAGHKVEINAQLAAAEFSYDYDWLRPRASFMWASGDSSPFNRRATGFDAILDNPDFAGGQFSYYQSNAIGLFGTQLTNFNSFLNNLRSSKFEGQANFVNPGLLLYNLGIEAGITQKLRATLDVNFLQFAETNVLSTFVHQDHIRHNIGLDYSIGLQYRPHVIGEIGLKQVAGQRLQSKPPELERIQGGNSIITVGASALTPGDGFRDIYTHTTLYSVFTTFAVAF